MSQPLFSKPTLASFFREAVRVDQGRWSLLALSRILGEVILSSLMPYAFKLFFEQLSGFTGDKRSLTLPLIQTLLLVFGCYLTSSFCFTYSDYLTYWIFPRLGVRIRKRMVHYTQYHSQRYFSDNFAGALSNRIADMTLAVSRILKMTTHTLLPNLFVFIATILLFTQLTPLFGGLLLFWFLVHLSIICFFAPRCSRQGLERAQSRSLLFGKIVDLLTNIQNVQLFARQREEMAYLQTFQSDEEKKYHTAEWGLFALRCWMHLAHALLMMLGFFGLLIYAWQREWVNIAEVTYIFYSSERLAQLAWHVGLELPDLFTEVGKAQQALQMLETPHEIRDQPGARPLKVTAGTITFDQVTFSYTSGQTTLNQITETIQPQEKVGLVGLSGAGKSTLLNLLIRRFDIESGNILIDGQNIAEVTQASLYQQVAMVPQASTLFHRSLLENIRYGCPEASDIEVLEAAKQAEIDHFVQSLPQGYHTLVGERGVKISGGQRQRIAIARALIKNAPILLLDEATSALDSITEHKIQRSIQRLTEGRTVIVIAHRLSTLLAMDRILVFSQGAIVESGTHATLLKQKGQYHKLWQMQMNGFIPRLDGT